jgi:hypothetical protein
MNDNTLKKKQRKIPYSKKMSENTLKEQTKRVDIKGLS